jgi:hypothetical protein
MECNIEEDLDSAHKQRDANLERQGIHGIVHGLAIQLQGGESIISNAQGGRVPARTLDDADMQGRTPPFPEVVRYLVTTEADVGRDLLPCRDVSTTEVMWDSKL